MIGRWQAVDSRVGHKLLVLLVAALCGTVEIALAANAPEITHAVRMTHRHAETLP